MADDGETSRAETCDAARCRVNNGYAANEATAWAWSSVQRGELRMRARTYLIVLALASALVALSGVVVFLGYTREMRKERHRTVATAVKPADDPWPECVA